SWPMMHLAAASTRADLRRTCGPDPPPGLRGASTPPPQVWTTIDPSKRGRVAAGEGVAAMRIIGPILGVLGILLIFGLVAGIAYSAGLAAAGVVVAPGVTPAVVPAVGYAWYGGPWFGFG